MKQQKVRKTTIHRAVENLIKKRGQSAGHKVVDFIYTLKSAAGYSRGDVEEATEVVLEKLMAEGTLRFTIRNAKLLRLTAEPKKADHSTVDNAETQRLGKAIIIFSRSHSVECENLTPLITFLHDGQDDYKFGDDYELLCHCLTHLVATATLCLRIRLGQFMQIVSLQD